jgi:hypothetical protein
MGWSRWRDYGACVFCIQASTPSKKKRAPGEETEAQRRRREAREAELAATRKWWEEDMEFEDGQKWKVHAIAWHLSFLSYPMSAFEQNSFCEKESPHWSMRFIPGHEM